MPFKYIVQRYNKNEKAPWAFSLSAAYLLSGFCALVYQMVWIRKFSLVFGSTVLSMSIVTAVFFGGLAIGSRLFGKISTFSKNPVRLYAIIEIIVSLYALMFPWILGAFEQVYASIYPAISSSFFLLVLVRASTACVILLFPTVLMGGTLPILIRHFVTRLAMASRQAGMIYGLNALGAALGSFLAGYVFLRAIGVSKTNLLAGMVNLTIGLVTLAISSQTKLSLANRIEGNHGKLTSHEKTKSDQAGIILLTMVCFGISGFVSMAYEMIWLRHILFFFRDTSYLYSGIIAVFILGIAIGSLLCRWIVTRIKASLSFFGFLQMGIGLSTILAIYLPIHWHYTIFEAGERSSVYVLLLLFSLLIIPTVFMGATFPVVAKIISTEVRTVGNQVGRAYALNTVGSILGSLAGGYLFFLVMGLQAALFLLFGLNMILATVLIISEKHSKIKYWGVVPLSFCLLFPISIENGFDYHLPDIIIKKLSSNEEILEIAEGITGTTWASKAGHADFVMLHENRIVYSRDNSSSFIIQGYIPQLLTSEIPQKFLGLCFGGGLSYHAGKLFPEIKRFDFVDISEKNIELALRHFSKNEGLRDDPRARFIIDDAYNFVKYSHDKYGLIIMDPNPPVLSYRCATLYTKEFYELASERLTMGGLFTQVLPLRHMSDIETMSVMKTFSSIFKNCLLWWNGFEPVMVGSDQEFHLDIREIGMRIKRPLIYESLVKFSKEADYGRLSHFLSGLLLTTEDFRKVAAAGIVYTNDLTELEFSTGRDINVNNIIRIHRSLSPWAEAKKIFFGIPDLESYVPDLEARREYLMGVLYRQYRLSR